MKKLIIVTILLLFTISSYLVYRYYSHIEFQGLPIKVIIKGGDKDAIYALDLSKTFFNKGNLSVVAEPIKSMTGILSNKNSINGEYSIGEYALFKNGKKVYTLDFGYDQSFAWFKDTLIFKGVKNYNSKEDIGGKLSLQMSKIVVIDTLNKQDYWINVIDPKKINEKYQNIYVKEVLGYME